jgi:hypothetical protein
MKVHKTADIWNSDIKIFLPLGFFKWSSMYNFGFWGSAMSNVENGNFNICQNTGKPTAFGMAQP